MLGSVDVRRLLIFRSVAHAGSIGAAARSLGWTQPAVSQHMLALEREVGHPLLVRGPRGVTLTEAGRLLVDRADTISAAVSAAENEQRQLAQLGAGTVRVAIFPSAAATLLPRALAALREVAPQIELQLTEAEPPEAHQLLLKDRVDLAVVFAYDNDTHPLKQDLRSYPITNDLVCLVLPPGHPQAAGHVRLVDLAHEHWITGCERCRSHLCRLAAAAGFEPQISHSTDDYVAAQYLVAAGLGVTLLPQAALAAFSHPDVVIDRSTHWGSRHISVLARDGAAAIPAVATFLDCLHHT